MLTFIGNSPTCCVATTSTTLRRACECSPSNPLEVDESDEAQHPVSLHRQFLPQPDGGRRGRAISRATASNPIPPAIETHGLDPYAVQVMAEVGIDISRQRSKHLDELRDVQFDYVVTVCGRAHEHCPIFPGKVKVVHVGFDDPPQLAADARTEEERLAPYRRVRDEIRRFIMGLPEALPSPERAGTAVARFAEGFNCAQAVFSVYAEQLGLDHDTALRVAAGFGGGMGRMASTCGAVTGAFMALGLRYGGTTPDRQAKEAIYARIQEFADRFKARNGTLICRELLGCDISSPDGLEKAKAAGLLTTVCPKLVQDACEILEEIHLTDGTENQ